MSDNWLRYVPTDPWHQPTADAIASATTFLEGSLPQAEEITAKVFQVPHLIDAGANWSGVLCPTCGTDLEDWWQQIISEHAEGGFHSLQVEIPCCRVEMSLNDLQYPWPVAFGRFVLDVMNPNVPSLGTGIGLLQGEIGCQLREVRQHI